MRVTGRGVEWVVDAGGCDPAALRSTEVLGRVFAEVVADLGLHAAAEPVFHRFSGEGGVTGFLLLQESHLACHTYPEAGFATLNLYTCGTGPQWPWEKRLADLLGATSVSVRRLERGFDL